MPIMRVPEGMRIPRCRRYRAQGARSAGDTGHAQGARGHGGTGPTSTHFKVQVRVPVRWRRATSPGPRAAPGESRRCLSLLPGPQS